MCRLAVQYFLGATAALLLLHNVVILYTFSTLDLRALSDHVHVEPVPSALRRGSLAETTPPQLPLAPPPLPPPPQPKFARVMTHDMVASELLAVHSWAVALVASNRRIIEAVKATLLPESTSKASRAIFRPLLHRAEASLRSTLSIDFQVGDAISLEDPIALFKTPRPRILCAVPTAWPRDEYRFTTLEKTWTQHCDIIKFVVGTPTYHKYKLATHKYADSFLHVPVTRTEDPKAKNIWEKSWRMWKLISELHGEDADFFVKTDTDAFLMVENLRSYVRHFDAEKMHYLGHTMLQRWGTENVKFNIGAGYVMSRASLRGIGKLFQGMQTMGQIEGKMACVDREGAGEDPTMSICLRDLGVLADNTLDSRGRQRFFPFRVVDHLNTPRKVEDWYWGSKTRDTGVERTCCASHPIMFHNYKEHGVTFFEIYRELDYWFHTAVGGKEAFRFSEPPDHGLFRYDPDSIHFKIDARPSSIRDACGIWGGPKCRGVAPPTLKNRPRSPELMTPFTYDHKGAGGKSTKPCIDTFCRDQGVDSSL